MGRWAAPLSCLWTTPNCGGTELPFRRKLNRLEEWADMNLTKVNKDECKVLYLG